MSAISTFNGLNISLQGLYVSRTGLDTTSHNISNSNTKGYTRQLIEQRATRPISLKTGKGMLGTGAEVYDIKQVRSEYLDRKYRSEKASYGEYSSKSDALSQLEMIINSAAEENFSSALGDFFDSMQTLSTNPSDEAYLTVARQKAVDYTKYFNDAAQRLINYQEDLNYNVKAAVDEINNIATQIQSINRQIYKMEIDGNTANDLRDKRNLLVDELSELINVEVNEYQVEGTDRFRVSINGQILVDHFDTNKLETRAREIKGNYDEYWEISVENGTAQHKNADVLAVREQYENYLKGNSDGDFQSFMEEVEAGNITLTASQTSIAKEYAEYAEGVEEYLKVNTQDLYDVYWEGSTVKLYNEVNYNSMEGKLKGYLDVRDGNSSTASSGEADLDESIVYKGIPYYLGQLNKFVQTFSQLMNEGKAYNGTQLSDGGGFSNGYNINGETGIGWFSYKSNTVEEKLASGKDIDYSKITALNFSISSEISDSVKNMATTYDENSSDENNDMILDLISLRHNNKAFSQGEIDDFMTAVTSQLAVDKAQATSFEEGQENILLSVENQRESVSGVSMNEELTNMIKYQKVYAASARMISTMDEIYNITINKLGN